MGWRAVRHPARLRRRSVERAGQKISARAFTTNSSRYRVSANIKARRDYELHSHLQLRMNPMKDEKKEKDSTDLQRRSLLKNTAAATIGLGALNAVPGQEAHAEEIIQPRAPTPEIVQQAARPSLREASRSRSSKPPWSNRAGFS